MNEMAPGLGPDTSGIWVGACCDRCRRLIDGIAGYNSEDELTVCADCLDVSYT